MIGGGPLLLVGCGKMGGGLLTGWLGHGMSSDSVTVVEPDEQARRRFGDRGVRGLPDLAAAADLSPVVVVLAIKPQQMAAVVPRLARFARPQTVFLSIAAGKTIAFLARHLGEQAGIVRAMPNTPAAVGRGMTVLCANAQVNAAQRAQCEELMAAAGEVAWVEDEGLLDAVTAVSGGGPAYVFLLIECLARAGVEAGLPEALAMRIARETVSGSGELARLSPEEASQLRKNVTSPGGTTQAALEVLMAENGLQPLVTRAILAAARRSRELAD